MSCSTRGLSAGGGGAASIAGGGGITGSGTVLMTSLIKTPSDCIDGVLIFGIDSFGISSKTEWPDVAANFLDFMTGPETADLRANGGYAPLLTDVEIAESTQLINEYNAQWKKVIAEDGLTLFLDWSTVGMGAVLFPAIQELIANRIDSNELVKRVQAEWEAGRG